eukprot:Nk52_evm62s352 gene=Nk52_evmTU62s352
MSADLHAHRRLPLDTDDENEIMKDIKAQYPTERKGIDCIILVDNIPKVPKEKQSKLVAVLGKIFNQMGKVRPNGIFMPNDTKGVSTGICFVEFMSPEHASTAVKKGNGYKLDKAHVFEVYMLTDVEKYMEIPDKFSELAPEEYKEKDNYRWWLLDENCRDQFVIRHGFSTSIFFNGKQELEKVHQRENWTDSFVKWSPMGSYMATFHRQGIALWGGESWDKVARFSHPGVRLVDISPCENYLVTWSEENPKAQNIHVWNIRTEEKMRSFENVGGSSWPALKWNSDGKYFAKQVKDAIQVYETPSMKLLDKKSIKVPEVKEFQWSPTDPYISFWVPESGDNPARVTIMEIPSRKEIRVKNLFSVSECKMFWQSKGDFFAVKVDRYTKTKKSTFTNFELFRVREKQVPVDVLEMKDTVKGFEWEPSGNRFGVIHGDSSKLNVSFYALESAKNGGKVELLKTLEKKTVNRLYWSPKGRFVVVAGLRSLNGILEFWDVENMVSMNNTEHFMATDLEWDPTGRYVATSVSYWHHQMENGYNIWSFQGRLLHKQSVEKLTSFNWRPRPPSLLTEAEKKAVKKGLKDYSVKFDRADMLSQSKVSADLLQKRAKLADEFEAWRKEMRAQYENEHAQRVALQGVDYEAKSMYVEEEETVEVFIGEKVEVV